MGCGAAGPSLRGDESPASLYLPRRHTVTQAFYWIAAASKRDTSPCPALCAMLPCNPGYYSTMEDGLPSELSMRSISSHCARRRSVPLLLPGSRSISRTPTPPPGSGSFCLVWRAVCEPSKKCRLQLSRRIVRWRSPARDFPQTDEAQRFRAASSRSPPPRLYGLKHILDRLLAIEMSIRVRGLAEGDPDERQSQRRGQAAPGYGALCPLSRAPGLQGGDAFAFAVGKARRTGFASSIGRVGGSATRHEWLMSKGGRPKRQPPSGHRAS